jgi:hypothetical protein
MAHAQRLLLSWGSRGQAVAGGVISPEQGVEIAELVDRQAWRSRIFRPCRLEPERSHEEAAATCASRRWIGGNP